MSGGAASAKTTSYVLVAADAGTAISMTSTSATTITVNKGLFAAGDTVFIQNLGSATCTITAGTATVNTAGSLILPQYDAGILYFVSSSSAVFYDYIQTGATSPLTTKGDLYGFGTSDARIPIGANNTVLTADSGETLGLKWAAPSGGGATYAVFQDVKASGAGGTFTQGSFLTRDLQTTQYNGIAGCSLASNQITLAAGTYIVNAMAPAGYVDQHQTRFYNITDSATAIIGGNAYNGITSASVDTYSALQGGFTIAAQKVFELQHRCTTTKNGTGFGTNNGFSAGEVYSIVTIAKVA
jgi:hypothetical protein